MIVRLFGYTALSIISAAFLGVAGILAFLLADRALPIEVMSSEVLTPIVRSSGKLMTRQRVRYTRVCRSHVDRVLYDNESRRQYLSDIDYERPPRGLGEL